MSPVGIASNAASIFFLKSWRVYTFHCQWLIKDGESCEYPCGHRPKCPATAFAQHYVNLALAVMVAHIVPSAAKRKDIENMYEV
jgi:hypothetical protein